MGSSALLPGAENELSGFLSLVTDILENIPAIDLTFAPGAQTSAPSVDPKLPSQTEPPPYRTSNALGTALTSKSKNKNSAGDLTRETKKNDKNEELAAVVPQERPSQEPAAVSTTPALAVVVRTQVPELPIETRPTTLGENEISVGVIQDPIINVGLTAARGDVAFALRLTPSGPEAKNVSQVPQVPQALNPITPAATGHSSSGSVPAQARPSQSSDSNSAMRSTLPSGITIEMPQPASPTFKEATANSAGLRIEIGPKPVLKNDYAQGATPGLSTEAEAPTEEKSEPRIASDHPYFRPQTESLEPASEESMPLRSTSVAKKAEDTSAWSRLRSPKQDSPKISQAPPEDSPTTEGQDLKSGDGTFAAAASEEILSHHSESVAATGVTSPVKPRSVPQSSPDIRSDTSQPETKESKNELPAKRDPQEPRINPVETRINDGHTQASAIGLTNSAQPADSAGGPPPRVSHPALAESQALKVASEPEIKTSINPPNTRQISLKLSTDDSTQVNVNLTERAGKVLVAVRTPDHELAQSLQTDLGDLVGRLESKGFKTETWIPAAAHQAVPLSQSSNSNTGFGQSQHSGSGNGGAQQRQGQNSSNQRQKARWASQLEQTMSSNETRSES